MPTPDRIHGDDNVFRVLDRVQTAVELYRDGHTWEEVAQVCGYANKGSAWNAVMAYMREHTSDRAADLRAIEGRRMDADELRLRQLIATSTDEKVVIRAVDARTRLSARRARLFGLDAPVEVAISTGATAEVEDALALLREAIDQRLASEQQQTVAGEVVARGDDQPATPDPDSR